MTDPLGIYAVINQQTDLALDSNQGSVVAKVVHEFNVTMRDTQATWLKQIDLELARQRAGPGQPKAPEGLVEYLMALANDQVKSADFTEALSTRLEALVSDKYKTQIIDKLNDAMDGYLDVAKRCIQVLIDLVFDDSQEAVRKLFTPEWYSGDPTTQIVETISDYMVDFSARLSPSLFELLVDDIIDTFLIAYLTALRKANKLKMPKSVNKMSDEIKKSFDFFVQYKQPKELESYFEVVSRLFELSISWLNITTCYSWTTSNVSYLLQKLCFIWTIMLFQNATAQSMRWSLSKLY